MKLTHEQRRAFMEKYGSKVRDMSREELHEAVKDIQTCRVEGEASASSLGSYTGKCPLCGHGKTHKITDFSRGCGKCRKTFMSNEKEVDKNGN